jgi:hypothetical protein
MTTCVRKAWLAWQGQTMALEDENGGWYCTQLNLGWPEVREVVNNKPAQDGTDDLSQYWGSRAVTADIVADGQPVDQLAAQFGKYMLPSIRPILHYVLDRPGAPERTLTLRASGYSWPISGKQRREVHLAWVAPDPIARDVVTQTATAWSGSSSNPGRTYNLIHNRIYPPGGGSATTGTIRSAGDVFVKPLLRIYGPITAARVQMAPSTGGSFDIYFKLSSVISSGQYVEIDTAAHTAYLGGDPTQSVISQMDWSSSNWPALPPAPAYSALRLYGTSTAGMTQVQAFWQDGYIT